MTSDTRLQQLFHVLRMCGAGMIVAAAGTFLVQSWDQTGGVIRYLALLAMTALLPIVAYFFGVRFQEGRSARVMVLAFLALVPIHAGVLGGFVLSQFGAPGASLTPVAQWVAPSPWAAMLLVAAAAAVLLPLSWGAFRVLARRHAGLLTACSAGAHALLLVPNRSALAATLTLLPIFAIAAWCAKRIDPQTREAKLAVGSLVAPGVIIAARQVLFYDASNAFWAAVTGAGAALLFSLGRKLDDKVLERGALVPTLLASGVLVDDLTRQLDVAPVTEVLGYGWLPGVVLLGMALRSQISKRFFVLSAMMVNAVTAAFALMVESLPLAALQMIAVGLGLCSYGFLGQRRAPLLLGIGLTGVGFIAEVAYAIESFEPGGWLALAGFGVVLIALTAWLERRARAVRLASSAANLSRGSDAPVSRWHSNTAPQVAE